MSVPTQQQAHEALEFARQFGGTGLDEPFSTLFAFIEAHPDTTEPNQGSETK